MVTGYLRFHKKKSYLAVILSVYVVAMYIFKVLVIEKCGHCNYNIFEEIIENHLEGNIVIKEA